MTTREEWIYEIAKDILERFLEDEDLSDSEWLDEFYEAVSKIKASLEG